MAKAWHGRFRKPTHPLMERFTASLAFDQALAREDLDGSRAHADMLRAVGLLSAAEHRTIRRGLDAVGQDIATGRIAFDDADEDIHMAVEAALIRLVGEPAKKLHTARSRNDQVATDLRLWTRRRIDRLDTRMADVQRALTVVARREHTVVIPGYTHLQRAQPVMLGQHLLAYVEMLDRDRERLADARRRVNRLPLGAGALAGTTLPIDRRHVMKALGFGALCNNSLDAVGDRDFVVETLAALALAVMHLSRLAEDVILWTSSEWRLARLDDAWSTGSSIMPQKRNPDLMELVRGKTGRITGALVAVLTLLKGLPMAYNRDLQEDKEPLFDAVRTMDGALACVAAFLPTLSFDRARAAELLRGGFLDATILAEYLVEKGLPFRTTHMASGVLVRLGEESRRALAEIPLAEMRHATTAAGFATVANRLGNDLHRRLNPARAPAAYRSEGNAGPAELRRALARWEKRLEILVSPAARAKSVRRAKRK